MAIRPELRDELMNLPAEERLELAEALYASVPEAVNDPAWDQAWADEIRKRIDDIRSGRVQGVPADDAFARIRQRLADRG